MPPEDQTALPVEFLFHLDATIGDAAPVPVPGGPHGDRLIVDVSGGRFEGPKLRGRVVPGPSSEWASTLPGGGIRVDVRMLLETDDGAAILVTYLGVGWLEDGKLRVRTGPVFQTGDERYRWLNTVQAVGIGTPTAEGIAYDVYRVL